LAFGGSLLSGCDGGGADVPSYDIESVQDPVIGGSALSVASRRSIGNVDVNASGGGCSGVLLDPDTVLTAYHCFPDMAPTSNQIQAPKTDGTMETRPIKSLLRVGASDLVVMKLQTPRSATWPTSPNYTMSSLSPGSLPGNTGLTGLLTCYGRGGTGYAKPSGLVFGGWRYLTRNPASYDATANVWYVYSDANGGNITAPGDSGGACFDSSGNPAGVVSGGNWDCADHSNNDANCKATITKINWTSWQTTYPFRDYIQAVKTREAANFQVMQPANLWKDGVSAFSANAIQASVINGIVHLRGAMVSGSSTTLFTLPAAARPSSIVYVPVTLVNSKKGRLIVWTDGTTSVQAESGTFSDASGFTSLDGVSFAVSNAGFTNLTLNAGWAQYGTRNAAVKDDNGMIRLEGSIKATGAGSLAFTLPTAFRPSTRVYLPLDLCNATKGRLTIEPTGESYVYAEGGAWSNAQCFVSLEGVSFAKSASGTTYAPQNGWALYPGSRSLTVRNYGGIVRFTGSLSSSGTNTTLFNLSQEFRPATNIWVEADLCNAKRGRVLIQPNGNVSVQYRDALGDATCFTSLEGVEYGL
jgi:hypothetical protein